jgi:hypothetical protein
MHSCTESSDAIFDSFPKSRNRLQNFLLLPKVRQTEMQDTYLTCWMMVFKSLLELPLLPKLTELLLLLLLLLTPELEVRLALTDSFTNI